MNPTVEVRLPKYPECWSSCGQCGGGEIIVDDVLVAPGDRVARDDTLIVLETGKVALDIPSPHAGTVLAIHVAPGDRVAERQVIVSLAT